MKRSELEHALRAASDISGETVVLVIGSQSILGSFPDDVLPAEATRSREVDFGFFNDPGGRKADLVEGAIGEDSDFDRTYAYYVDGVDTDTATLPHGWWERLVTLRTASTEPAEGRLLEPHDCACSKLAAYREKDLVFVEALLNAGLIHVDVLVERVGMMDISDRLRDRMLDWLNSWPHRG